MLSIALLPEDVLIEIFSLVPPLDLIHCCRLVCSQWRDIIDSSTLWKMICQRMGHIPKDCKRHPNDWKKYYYLCSRRRNLLKNTCAEEEFQSWKLERDGGHKWKIEALPGEHGQQHPDETVTKYFVTSFGLCLKSQLINLKKLGYTEELMDRDQPDIVIRDWFAARADCACQYKVLVQLLSKDKKTLCELSPEEVIIPQWSDAVWQEMTYTFRNYGPGVRYIYFSHGGKDMQWWAGWYGVRVTNTSVTIEPEDLTVESGTPPTIKNCTVKRRKLRSENKIKS